MDDNPYASPRADGSDQQTRLGREASIRSRWFGAKLGAQIGCAIGAGTIILILCMNRQYGRTTMYNTVELFILFSAVTAFLGALMGAAGFGLIALARRFRQPDAANTGQPQTPPSADQRAADG